MLQLTSIVLLIALRTTSALPLNDLEHNHDLELETDPDSTTTLHTFSVSPELVATATEFPHAELDPILQQLDEALTKLANVYMQALFSGTHTPQLEQELEVLELALFDLLDSLYKEQRMAEYMKYESEVTHKMIIYNLLKRLFGYTKAEE